MDILVGKKIEKVESLSLESYEDVLIDIGTGSGRYPYERAKDNPKVFCIGLDPATNMEKMSVKSRKKEAKGGVRNLLYVISSLENAPQLLNGLATEIYVTLPWGSLLEGIVKGEEVFIKNIVAMAQGKGTFFRTCFSYSSIHEPSEIEKRGLPLLSLEYLNEVLSLKYKSQGIEITKASVLTEEDLKSMGTLWAKKLSIGKTREIFLMEGSINKSE